MKSEHLIVATFITILGLTTSIIFVVGLWIIAEIATQINN
jgi:hypothetical protein